MRAKSFLVKSLYFQIYLQLLLFLFFFIIFRKNFLQDLNLIFFFCIIYFEREFRTVSKLFRIKL